MLTAPPMLANVSPSFNVKAKGSTIDLFCEAVGTPEPTLFWLKDGKELEPSERLIMEGNR